MKAKAVVFTEKSKVSIQEVTLSEMADNEVLVDVEYSFVSSGTERWVLNGKFHYGSEQDYAFPLIPGYQHTGQVVATGKDVKSVKPGDRVFGSFNKIENILLKWGGHCSKSIEAESNLICLPENVSNLTRSSLVIAQVGYNGGSRPPVEPGDIAVVLGDGLIGQFIAQNLRLRGAYVIIAGKSNAKRLEYARKYSCDMAIDTAQVDIKAQVAKLAPEGVKIVIEAIGIPENTSLAYDLLAYNGHYVLNGFYPVEHRVDLNPLSWKEITVYNPASIQRPRMIKTLNLMAKKKLNVLPLITHVIKFSDASAAYESLVLNEKEFSLGIAIDWRDA